MQDPVGCKYSLFICVASSALLFVSINLHANNDGHQARSFQLQYGQNNNSFQLQNHLTPFLAPNTNSKSNYIEKASKILEQYAKEQTLSSPIIIFVPKDKPSPSLSELISLLTQKKYPYEIISIPDNEHITEHLNDAQILISKFNKKNNLNNSTYEIKKIKVSQKIKNWWKEKYISPTSTEVYQGLSIAAYKGVLVSSIWFSIDGISPLLATSMVTAMTLHELFFTIFIRTHDNILNGQQSAQSLSFRDIKTWKMIRNRFAYSTFFTYLWRSMSGAVGAAHSVTSLHGNMEIFSNSLAKLPAHWLSSVKYNNLSRKASAWVGYPLFLLGPLFSNLDLAGYKFTEIVTLPSLKFGEMVLYEPSLPVALLFSTYLGSAALIHWGPSEYIEKYAQFMENLFQKIKQKIQDQSIRIQDIKFKIRTQHSSFSKSQCRMLFKK